MIFNRERPSFEAANNVTVKRCFYAYLFASGHMDKQSRVLDIGCADGYGTSYLATHCGHITGVDYSAATIADAQRQFNTVANLDFTAAKVPPLPVFGETADVVTAFQFIEHIHERKQFIREVKRVLKTGGTFICTTPNSKRSLARNPYHVHEYTFGELEKEMLLYFEECTVLGLHGNDKVNKYYHENGRWVHKILRYDILGIHKILPSYLLYAPYNLLTSMMRNDLMKKDDQVTAITTDDFYLSDNNLDEAIDIFIIARKKKE